MINLSVLDESTLVTPIVAEIFVTDSAQKKMKEILDDFDSEKRGMIRFVVSAGGCSGFMYDLQVETKNPSDKFDVVQNYDGFDVVVDKKTMNLTQGTKIDYMDGLMQSGFKIENPKAQATCGCGQSFA
jgi:iron-sulfur cluster assembly accessory protein